MITLRNENSLFIKKCLYILFALFLLEIFFFYQYAKYLIEKTPLL